MAAARALTRRSPIILGVVVLVALALRLPHLDQSVWFDEAYMSNQVVGSWFLLLRTIYVDIHPPLSFLFMHFWNGVFGDSEIALRMPSLLCGLATIPLTYLVGIRLVGNAAGWWAAILLALSPVHIWYSIEARPYAAMVCLIVLLVLLFERLMERPARVGTWALYWLVALVTVMLHYYMAVYVLVLAGLALLARRHEDRRRAANGLLLANGFALFAIAVYAGLRIALFELETSQGYLRSFTLVELFRLPFQWFWTANTLPAGAWAPSWRWWLWVLFQAVGVLVFLLGLGHLLGAMRRRPAVGRSLLYLLALPLFLLLLPWLGFPQTYIERSALPALPFFLLVVGAGLSALPTVPVRRAAGGVVLAISLVNLVAYFALGDEWTVYKPRPDWRAVAGYLGAEIEAGGAGRPLFTPVPNPRALSYYDVRIQAVDNLSPSTERASRLVRAIERRIPGALGRFLAERAGTLAERFEQHKAALRAGAKILIYSSGDGSLPSLRLDERRTDGVLYLLKDRWHPPDDRTADLLLRAPGLRVVEERPFRSVTVYKLAEVGR